jgi:N-terminal domain of anti-restriction factor ArdC
LAKILTDIAGSGVCDPLAVKAEASDGGASPFFRASACAERVIPLDRRRPVTAQPPLIAAWLVGFMRTPQAKEGKAMRTDIYQKITDQIVCELEKGVRPWLKPWNAEHSTGRITRPLRVNGLQYNGINVLMLWSAAMDKGYASPTWMTFKQALELKAHVRKGELGSLVVYAELPRNGFGSSLPQGRGRDNLSQRFRDPALVLLSNQMRE